MSNLLKSAIILSLVTLLTACGGSGSVSTQRSLEADFTETVEDFEEVYGVRVNYVIGYVDAITAPIPGAVAVCYTTNGQPTKIEVLRSAIGPEDSNKLWLILWHEMGHCSLGLPHSTIREDIMYYSMGRNLQLLNLNLKTRAEMVEALNERISRGGALPNPHEEGTEEHVLVQDKDYQ